MATDAAGAAYPGYTVRITGPGGVVGGLGALVGDRHVVTCAHVVNVALGGDPLSQPRPAGRVRVDFPLLDTGTATELEAEVVKWLPPPAVGAASDDIAGLRLAGGNVLPPGATPARLAVEPPRLGQRLYVFGYPATPPRPDGGRVATTVQGLVGNGRLQLDSAPDSALRVQPGFSGSPVFDEATGRVAGLLALAPEGEARDSRAISAGRLRLAWPEALAGRWLPSAVSARRREAAALTILHVSDPRFARDRLPGPSAAERAGHPLFGRLHADLAGLPPSLRPEVLVVTGNLTEQARPAEFQAAAEFIGALAEDAEIPRRHVAIVPGDHDVSRLLSMAYFAEQEGSDAEPVPPYWPKWRPYAEAVRDFYSGLDAITFTPDEQWTLFEMPDLAVVVAGLNSTMPDSHRESDHYGEVGARQLAWFAARLRERADQGWLRLAAVHHHVADGSPPAAALRDAGDLDRVLGHAHLVNMVLHGHAADAGVRRLPSGLLALSAGAAGAVGAQYQLLTVRRDGLDRAVRQYAVGQGRWVGDTRMSATGSDWQEWVDYPIVTADRALPSQEGARRERQPLDRVPGKPDYRDRPDGGDFFDRVKDATQAKCPGAIITERPEDGYLRVTVSRDGGRVDQWPVGVIDGPASGDAVDSFAERVHRQFAADVPTVRSELVYRPPNAPAALVEYARERGVLLRSLVEYQGLLDLSALAEAQRERLASDRIYPARLYVEQRYRIVAGGRHGDEIQTGLIDRAVRWLDADGARLVVVLGDFGRGKTSFLRQLTRVVPARLPGVQPILVELRGLEKAPSLDELLAQFLARQGVADINLGKLRFMISSGRIALLLDGFDELELRVGYENAAAYLQTLITAVTGEAKVILTSRTQHFLSTRQVRDALSGRLAPARTALGERVETRPESRVVVLEEFTDEQIAQFLTNRYEGDTARAQARFELIRDIGNLLDLAHNPRMLGFVADLDEARLRDAQDQNGEISAARLYEQIIDQWLESEAERHRHRGGLRSISKEERLAACTTLALRLWASKDPTIALQELSKDVTSTLTGLAERGYTEDQAAHTIASGSLLVRSEDEAFTFIHQSVMEWLVARAAAAELDSEHGHDILGRRRMSRLMVSFLADLAGNERAGAWANQRLGDRGASEAAKRNAIAVLDRLGLTIAFSTATAAQDRYQFATADLSGLDLRGLDLTGDSLGGASLQGADLRGMRLEDVDVSGVDLTGADLSGVVMIRGSLLNASLTGSNWNRAAVLGAYGLDSLDAESAAALTAAAVAGRDPVEVMVDTPLSAAYCVAFSPDGGLLAYGQEEVVKIADVGRGRDVRLLHGHTSPVNSVAFSPDGTLLATASDDGTARTWDPATGTARTTLTGHDAAVSAVAFSPDGTLIATASADHTARTWDTATGTHRTTLTGHDNAVNAVAFSPDGTLIATASRDRTARIWDPATGTARTTLTGHDNAVNAVAFSPDGTLLATASGDGTVRTWDPATGIHRTTLTGHGKAVNAVAFSPDGTLIATASSDDTARTWDPATGTHRTTLTGHNRTLWGIAFSRDGTVLATASDDGTARIWDPATGTHRTTLTRHDNAVTNVAFSPDGTLIATASGDGTVRTWDPATGSHRTTLTGHDGFVSAVAFSPDGTLIATASSDKTARIWDAATGTHRTTLKGHTRTLWGIAFSPDGSLLATASYDGTARVWALKPRYSRRHRVFGHEDGVNGVAFSPDGTLLATASDDSTARIWNLDGTPRATLSGHQGMVQAVAFSPDGACVATASSDGTARIWGVPTGKHLVTLVPLPDTGYATLLPDGAYKLHGDPGDGDGVWWAIKLCRFAAGELDPFVPGVRRLEAGEVVLPVPGEGGWG